MEQKQPLCDQRTQCEQPKVFKEHVESFISTKDLNLHYIYLLQTREFLNAKQPVYKIGKTTQEHNKRFNNYPKGSVLILQVICRDCHQIEKVLIEMFKKKFKLQNDIGAEYFEGDHIEMMDMIFSVCWNDLKNSTNIQQEQNSETKDNSIAKDCLNNIKQINEISYNSKGSDNTNKVEEIYIETYAIWSKFNNIEVVIIDNLGNGYFRCVEESMIWYKINEYYYSLNYMVKIHNIIEPPYTAIDVEKIYSNILKVCLCKKRPYEMLYHEFLIIFEDSNGKKFMSLYNSIKNLHKSAEELRNTMIICNDSYFELINHYTSNIPINIGMIIYTITNEETCKLYKKLMYNMLVIPSEKIIFYDYGTHLLSDLARDLCQALGISNQKLVSEIYFNNKKEYEKEMKNGKIRYAIISQSEENFNERLEYLRKSNIPNIIVKNYRDKRDFYNYDRYKKYINEEHINYAIFNEVPMPNIYELFKHEAMQPLFFEWCCRAPNADEL